MRTTAPTLTLLIAAAAWLIGCAGQPKHTEQASQEEAPVGLEAKATTFPVEQYPDHFNAAVEVLRAEGYRVARRDYRFGTITTYPRESSTALEFWNDRPATAEQARSSTLNAQQRRVKVTIQKSGTEGLYVMRVEVVVERLQRPARYLTHSATGLLTADYEAPPAHLQDRGIDGPYAQVLTRDPHLEAYFAAQIARKARTLGSARPDAEAG